MTASSTEVGLGTLRRFRLVLALLVTAWASSSSSRAGGQDRGLEHAREAINSLGGTVVREEDGAGNRVIRVDLTSSLATDNDMRILREIPDLRELILWGSKITDRGLAILAGLKELRGLQSLDLSFTEIGDEGLGHLAGFPRLRILHLNGARGVTDAGMSHLKPLAKLQALLIDSGPVVLNPDEGWVQRPRLTDGGLAALASVSSLEVLSVEGHGEITDAGMEHLARLKHLRDLTLAFTTITDAGLAHLDGLVEMRCLNLSGIPLTDAGLSHLRRMKHLIKLDLNFTQITDEGLPHLIPCKGLEGLNLFRARVTDKGLLHLRGAYRLEELDVTDTGVTSFGIERLMRTLPDLAVHNRQGHTSAPVRHEPSIPPVRADTPARPRGRSVAVTGPLLASQALATPGPPRPVTPPPQPLTLSQQILAAEARIEKVMQEEEAFGRRVQNLEAEFARSQENAESFGDRLGPEFALEDNAGGDRAAEITIASTEMDTAPLLLGPRNRIRSYRELQAIKRIEDAIGKARMLVESKAKELRDAQNIKQMLIDRQQAEMFQMTQQMLLQLDPPKPQAPK